MARSKPFKKAAKAATAIDQAADVYRAVGLVGLEIAKGVLETLGNVRREGRIKGRITIGLGPLPWKLTIEGEIDLPKERPST